jgi:DNA-binding response OmpR family regulator
VIVADDDAAMRMLCRVNLELDGYRVVEASSGSEVASALAEGGVAALLLDVQLGNDDGIELARQIRAEQPDVGIAFLTGSVQGRARQTAGELSAELIGKPFNLEALSEVVARLAPR